MLIDLVKELSSSYSIKSLCQILGVSRSTVYSRFESPPTKSQEDSTPTPSPTEAAQQRQALLDVAAQWPTYGYRRLHQQLKREGIINGKRVRRMMRELRLAAKPHVRKPRTTDSRHSLPRHRNLVKGLEAERPHHIWVADITYIRLEKEFVYLAAIMDVFTRKIQGWSLERSLGQELTKRALEKASPEIHHRDQGVQYAAKDYVELLQAAGVKVSMAEVGKPEDNGYAERLMRTIKEEEVALTEYASLEDARRQIGRFLEEVYNKKRIHSSLGYLTPTEFEAQWMEKQ